MLKENIALPSDSTTFISFKSSAVFVHHRTFTENQEPELIQISAKANKEALFEVLTVYPDLYQNALFEIHV